MALYGTYGLLITRDAGDHDVQSAPAHEMMDFPAENFVAFFSNHRLLQYDRPVWRTVKGGSRRYVEKLTFPWIRSASPCRERRRRSSLEISGQEWRLNSPQNSKRSTRTEGSS